MTLIQEEIAKASSLKGLTIALGIGALIGAGAGLAFAWKFWRTAPGPVETVAQAARQSDGSLMLERKPDATAKPAQEIPNGATVERIERATVQPRARIPGPVTGETSATSGNAQQSAASTQGLPATGSPCPPVTIDMTLVRMPDKTRRVIASSPDGDILASSLDIPVESAEQPRELKRAAGGVYGLKSGGGKSVGVFFDRDFAFLRTGIELTRETFSAVPAGWETRIKLGVKF